MHSLFVHFCNLALCGTALDFKIGKTSARICMHDCVRPASEPSRSGGSWFPVLRHCPQESQSGPRTVAAAGGGDACKPAGGAVPRACGDNSIIPQKSAGVAAPEALLWLAKRQARLSVRRVRRATGTYRRRRVPPEAPAASVIPVAGQAAGATLHTAKSTWPAGTRRCRRCPPTRSLRRPTADSAQLAAVGQARPCSPDSDPRGLCRTGSGSD